MDFGTFDPGQLVNIFNGKEVTGFGDGDSITIERDVDTYTDMAGLDGSVGRKRSADKRGTITYTLLQTSKMNDIFSVIFNLESLTSDISAAYPYLLKDNSGTSLIAATKVWIQKPPTVSYNSENITTRVWALRAADLIMYVGGNDE